MRQEFTRKMRGLGSGNDTSQAHLGDLYICRHACNKDPSWKVYNFFKLEVCELTLRAALKEHTNSWTLFCFRDILSTNDILRTVANLYERYGHDATSHTSSRTTEGLAQGTTEAGSKYHTQSKPTQLLRFPHFHPFHCLISHKLLKLTT